MIATRRNTSFDEPSSYEEAIGCPKQNQWQEAIKEKHASLLKNGTWCLERLPADCKAIPCKWVFRKKINIDGTMWYKARLVVKGYEQWPGIDYEETFASVAMLKTVRILLALFAAYMNWEVHHIDAKTAFLNPSLKEVVFIAQLEGFE